MEGLLLGCLKLPEPPELGRRAFVRLGAIVEGEHVRLLPHLHEWVVGPPVALYRIEDRIGDERADASPRLHGKASAGSQDRA